MLRYLAILGVGLALGLGTAAAAIIELGGSGKIHIGPWQSPLDAGGIGRGPYLQAAASLAATLALSRREAIYFSATRDSQGQPLQGQCSYSVHGPSLPARWWSITLYGSDHYLIANPERRYAYASANVARGPDGGFAISVSPHSQPGDWLDTAAAGHIILLTRLYQPTEAAAADPARISLPAIDRQGCR